MGDHRRDQRPSPLAPVQNATASADSTGMNTSPWGWIAAKTTLEKRAEAPKLAMNSSARSRPGGTGTGRPRRSPRPPGRDAGHEVHHQELQRRPTEHLGDRMEERTVVEDQLRAPPMASESTRPTTSSGMAMV